MDASKKTTKLPKPTKPHTLADVYARVAESKKLSPDATARLLSAILTAARLISKAEGPFVQLPLTAISADPDEIQNKLKSIKAGTVGMSVRHHTNMRSYVQRAIKIAGAKSARNASILLEWHLLLGQLPPHQRWRGLTVSLRRLSAKNIGPGTTTTEAVASVLADEVASLPEIEARRVRNKIVRLWHAAASKLDAWPTLDMDAERRSRWTPMAWSELPETLRAEVDAYLIKRSSAKRRSLGGLPTLKPRSAKKARDHFRYIASELVASGIPPDKLDLAFIVQPCNVEIAIERMRERLNLERGSGIANAIASVKAAAKHTKLLSKADLDLLETFRGNCAPEYDGQTDKNQARLDQFDDPRLCRRFIHLSDELMHEANTKRGSRVGARLAVLAVAFEFALRTAARGANISGIDHTRHLHKAGNGVVLRIPKGEVKNKHAIEFDVAPKLLAMLEAYFRDHHPILAPNGSNWLFPNQADPSKPRPDGSLMNALSTTIRRRLQIDFSGHTFRHLVGKLVIGLDSALAPLVPRILGHSACSSATDHYLSLHDRNSFKAWDQVIDQHGRGIRRPKSHRQPKADNTSSGLY
jgi:hypothetical protein